VGLQRSAHLISLMVVMRAMARASWSSRWWMNRSVVRRSCPKFDSQLLVRSTGQRIPQRHVESDSARSVGAALGDDQVIESDVAAELAHDTVVVAPAGTLNHARHMGGSLTTHRDPPRPYRPD
jgi:hypothetical protein